MCNSIASSNHVVTVDTLPTREGRRRPALQTIKFQVIVPNGHLTGRAYHLSYYPSDSSEEVMNKLRHLYNETVTTRWTRFWWNTVVCRKVTVETAILKEGDPSRSVRIFLPCTKSRHNTFPLGLKLTTVHARQVYPAAIPLPDSTPSKVLTSALHRRLAPPTPLFENEVNAVVLRPALDEVQLWYTLVFLLAMAPLCAILTAWHTGKIETGISVCICVFVMISTVQAVVAWSQLL